MTATTKQERAAQANRFLETVAGCGRKFFAHNGRVSRLEVDERGHVWFVDAYRPARIYTQCKWSKWRGFSEGGTLRAIVLKLCDYIRTGESQPLGLGPWPEWICSGDLWGYGDAMEQVRAAAMAHGLMPSNVELRGAEPASSAERPSQAPGSAAQPTKRRSASADFWRKA